MLWRLAKNCWGVTGYGASMGAYVNTETRRRKSHAVKVGRARCNVTGIAVYKWRKYGASLHWKKWHCKLQPKALEFETVGSVFLSSQIMRRNLALPSFKKLVLPDTVTPVHSSIPPGGIRHSFFCVLCYRWPLLWCHSPCHTIWVYYIPV